MEAPKRALNAFASLNEPWKGRAIKTFFQYQNSLDETELAELADSLNLTNYFEHWAYEIELAKVLHEPRSAFNLTLEAGISAFQKNRVLSRITRHWIEQTSTDDIRAKLNLVFEVLGDTWGIWGSSRYRNREIESKFGVGAVDHDVARNPNEVWQICLQRLGRE